MDQVIWNASPLVYDFIDFSALNYGEILSFITPEIRKTVRSLEKLFKKKESLIIGGKFLQRCLQEGLLPKFTEIYIYIYFLNHSVPTPYFNRWNFIFVFMDFK